MAQRQLGIRHVWIVTHRVPRHEDEGHLGNQHLLHEDRGRPDLAIEPVCFAIGRDVFAGCRVPYFVSMAGNVVRFDV